MRNTHKRRGRGAVLGFVIVVSVVGALGLVTAANAQKRPERPKHLVGGQLVEEPDMSDTGLVEKGPDGNLHVKKGVTVGVVGADGRPEKNADGTDKRVLLSEPSDAPPQVSPADAQAAAAKAKANGLPPWAGVTASGDLPAGSPPPEQVHR